MSHFNMLVFPAIVLPLTVRLKADMATVLGMSFWMYLLFGCTALPWGVIADRWGAGPLMRIYYAGAGISAWTAALCLDSPTALMIALAAIGFFSGIYHPAGLGIISKEIKRVSRGMGFNGMFGNLGLASAPLMAGLVNWLWGPKAAYFFLGGMNFLGLLLMGMFSMLPSQQSRETQTKKENGLLGAFIILLIAMMLGGIAYRAGTVILPTYFELKNEIIFIWLTKLISEGISQNLVATSITSLTFLVGMLGQYTGGRFAERFDPRLGYLLFFGLTGPAAFFMAAAGNLLLVGLAVWFFFFLLGMQPIENTLVAKFTPRRFLHSAFGTKFILTFGVGALAVKMVTTIQHAFQIEAVFYFIGTTSVVAIGVILVLIFKTPSLKRTQHVDDSLVLTARS